MFNNNCTQCIAYYAQVEPTITLTKPNIMDIMRLSCTISSAIISLLCSKLCWHKIKILPTPSRHYYGKHISILYISIILFFADKLSFSFLHCNISCECEQKMASFLKVLDIPVKVLLVYLPSVIHLHQYSQPLKSIIIICRVESF